MREILFRGFHPCDDGDKTVYVEGKAVKGRWVEGLPAKFNVSIPQKDGQSYIKPQLRLHIQYETENGYVTASEVLPYTVGQYTGLADKNGVKIFEGDELHDYDFEAAGIVLWSEDTLAFMWALEDGDGNYLEELQSRGKCNSSEVIGNTHEEGRDERLD